ncbi:malate:quinone oxidoreductase [Naasia sp. SYSU D00057]|uniref:malate:quinone oxidoreductase n=1 Tax=Naasia sp. SYSU D00057 TaxID=2817380 RepID=UPI001B3058D1|nr:malate:quinone oxidoreductase [Naasia sp. SYSU D00057]
MASAEPVDVVLIGGGIMSATLGTLLQQLEPTWSIAAYERLGAVAEESSNPWNNAGTGHAAFCELNYTPERPDGRLDIRSAIKVNEQFQVSRQFWSSLVESSRLPEATAFVNSVPHMTFVRGAENVRFLRQRFDALKDEPLFAGLEFSDDPRVLHEWAPLLIEGRRKDEPVAATRIEAGTDVDFGALTRALFDRMVEGGAQLHLNAEVKGLKKDADGLWRVRVKQKGGTAEVRARFVFVGAGGWALKMLQKSGIPEARGYGVFPISGQFLRTDNPEVVARHQAKVYGKASVGAPPMSVPHLDTRIVDGSASLMFGPYAGFSPKFLKKGSLLDLFGSVKPHNIIPLLAVAKDNIGLVRYLVGEVLASRKKKFGSLREFYPLAKRSDWRLIVAGQRAQVIKPDKRKGGVLQFGTEVIASADGSIAGLLGASPGASTAAPIMFDVLKRCFPGSIGSWEPHLKELVPTYGTLLSKTPERAEEVLEETARVLRLVA